MRPRKLPAQRLTLLASVVLMASTAPFLRSDCQATDAEFRRLASQIAAARLVGALENPEVFERALALLDDHILNSLRASSTPDLAALNRSLAALFAEDAPVSQSFRVHRFESASPVYALIVNFGLAGPSAVRIYSSGPGGFSLAARIDHLTQKNFFDEYLTLVPISASNVIFVTVTGRTDDLQTGSFAAWQFQGQRVELLWSVDLLQQSDYQVASDGFRLTYCAEPDERNPRECLRMTRDRFAWDAGTWRRVQQNTIPVPKR